MSKEDIAYIKSLGLLEEGEEIKMFDSQGGWGGIKRNGNFFTDKRMAFYWVDTKNKSKTNISSAFYHEIDTIIPVPLFHSLTYSSRLDVTKKDGNIFSVCVDLDSTGTWKFFNAAIEEWRKKK